VAPAELLDGGLLLHGDEAIRGVSRNRRPRAGGSISQVAWLLYARAAAGLDHVLRFRRHALPRRIYHALSPRIDPRVPAGGDGYGDLSLALLQEAQRRAESRRSVPRTGVDGGGYCLHRRDGNPDAGQYPGDATYVRPHRADDPRQEVSLV